VRNIANHISYLECENFFSTSEVQATPYVVVEFRDRAKTLPENLCKIALNRTTLPIFTWEIKSPHNSFSEDWLHYLLMIWCVKVVLSTRDLAERR
jgi:hypothetical protein